MSMISSLIGGVTGLLGQMTSSLSGPAAPAPSQAATASKSYTHQPSRHEKLMSDALRAQDLDEDSIAEIQQQINETIAQMKANGDVSRESVKYAVNGVLKQYGVDVNKFEAYMQAHQPKLADKNAAAKGVAETEAAEQEIDTYA